MWSTLPPQAADLPDPRTPRFLGNREDELRTAGEGTLLFAHEAWPSPDGTRLYAGGQMAGGEKLFVINVEDWPQRSARILGRTPPPGHSIRPATIDGKPHLLHSTRASSTPPPRAACRSCSPRPAAP